MAAPKYPTNCVERFLDYVTIDTQAREGSDDYPSTPGQLVLLRRLRDELEALGLDDVVMDEHGYVFGTVPATVSRPVPTVGFIAHVDTSPEMSGAGVVPIVHRNYDGDDLVLPDDPNVVISPADHPALRNQIGNDIVTASGTTLLGADDKAGVAEIMAAAEYLMSHRDIPHGPIRVGFTPDEEIGAGTRYFDVERFGAVAAYTLDGENPGDLENETFSADAMTVTFLGRNIHPGFATGLMVNSIKVAADFIARLPSGRLSPEATAGREGFVHPYHLDASVDRTAVRFIVRDFDTANLAEMERMLAELARETVADHPGARVETDVVEQYRNMREILDRHPAVVEHAREAIRRAGLDLRMRPIRGGTDGSRLCFMGLPTPNLFAGEHGVHSKSEWISTADMHKAVEVIIELAQVWAEES